METVKYSYDIFLRIYVSGVPMVYAFPDIISWRLNNRPTADSLWSSLHSSFLFVIFKPWLSLILELSLEFKGYWVREECRQFTGRCFRVKDPLSVEMSASQKAADGNCLRHSKLFTFLSLSLIFTNYGTGFGKEDAWSQWTTRGHLCSKAYWKKCRCHLEIN